MLTLRPDEPKPCNEFAMNSIPSHNMLCTSSSWYSSVTVGRKNTSLPPGFNIQRAKRTKSVANADSSYGFVGGIYGWSSLCIRNALATVAVSNGRAYGRGSADVTTALGRSFLRPRRFAPARTPSVASDANNSQPCHYTSTGIEISCYVHGGSVMMASNRPPQRHGFRVTSNVHRSRIRWSTLYCAAALITPGRLSVCMFRGNTCQWDMTPKERTSPLPRICLPSMSEPNTRAPKCAVV